MKEVTIDLTKEFSVEDVRALIGSVDDKEPRQFRVTKEGIGYLASGEKLKNLGDPDSRFDPFDAENGYTGKEASEDEKYVKKVYEDLKEIGRKILNQKEKK